MTNMGYFIKSPGHSGRGVRHLMMSGVIACLLGAFAGPAYATYTSEYFFFPAAGFTVRSEDPPGDPKKSFGGLELDFFYTADIDNIRVLAEIFSAVDEDKEVEIERLQMSWAASPQTRIWLGRFHNPLGGWNTLYHHGKFLQTSISRPGIVEFEDDGGILPVHVFGALIEGRGTPFSENWNYDIGVGAGPENDEGLEPVKVLQPGIEDNGIALSARLYMTSPEEPNNHLGIFTAYTEIPGSHGTPADIRQRLIGVFAHWTVTPDFRAVAEWFAINNTLTGAGTTGEGSFNNGYLQLEYNRQPSWTFYGRVEGSDNAANDPYLNLFPDFIRERQLLGIRYDIANNQSIKAEISKLHYLDDKYNEATIQWSAVYP